jgi:hypothetical protein
MMTKYDRKIGIVSVEESEFMTVRMRSSVIGAVWALGLAVLCGLPSARAGSKVQVGQPCNRLDRPSLAEVDHASFDALLRKYVDDRGLVAYARWKASADDLRALDDYLARSVPPSTRSVRGAIAAHLHRLRWGPGRRSRASSRRSASGRALWRASWHRGDRSWRDAGGD